MFTLHITNTKIILFAPLKEGLRNFLSIPVESFNSHLPAESLMAFVKANQGKKDKVVLSLSNECFLYRQIKWDKQQSDWQIYQSILINFNEYFSKPLDEFLIDYECLSIRKVPYHEKIRHLLQIYAAPKSLIGSYISMLEYAGLKASAVDVDPSVLGSFLPGLEKVKQEFLRFLMLIEGKFLWLLDCKRDNIRYEKIVLSSWNPSDFLIFFQSFIGEEYLDKPEIFYVGKSQILSNIQEVLKNNFSIKCRPIDLFKKDSFLLEGVCPLFMINYPFSLAVHCGLRTRYGD